MIPRKKYLGIGLCLLLLAGAQSSVQAGDSLIDPAGELMALRDSYVGRVKKTEDPDQLAAMSLVASARAWALVARQLNEKYNYSEPLAAFGLIEADLQRRLSETAAPRDRQRLGLELLYRAVTESGKGLARARGDKATLSEIAAIEDGVERVFQPGASYAHSLVTLSGGTMSMLALVIRSVDARHVFTTSLNSAMTERVREARLITERQDIHMRGKLYLMALNNIRGCFTMVYLLNLAVDERLSPKAGSIYNAWRNNIAEKESPTVQLAVTLTAMAEATFPVTIALVRR